MAFALTLWGEEGVCCSIHFTALSQARMRCGPNPIQLTLTNNPKQFQGWIYITDNNMEAAAG
jgi:hypothetical protein